MYFLTLYMHSNLVMLVSQKFQGSLLSQTLSSPHLRRISNSSMHFCCGALENFNSSIHNHHSSGVFVVSQIVKGIICLLKHLWRLQGIAKYFTFPVSTLVVEVANFKEERLNFCEVPPMAIVMPRYPLSVATVSSIALSSQLNNKHIYLLNQEL